MPPRTPSAPRRLALAVAAIDRATRDRDAAILDLRAEGYSLREIGAIAGLSHVAIGKILRRNQVTLTD